MLPYLFDVPLIFVPTVVISLVHHVQAISYDHCSVHSTTIYPQNDDVFGPLFEDHSATRGLAPEGGSDHVIWGVDQGCSLLYMGCP